MYPRYSTSPLESSLRALPLLPSLINPHQNSATGCASHARCNSSSASAQNSDGFAATEPTGGAPQDLVVTDIVVVYQWLPHTSLAHTRHTQTGPAQSLSPPRALPPSAPPVSQSPPSHTHNHSPTVKRVLAASPHTFAPLLSSHTNPPPKSLPIQTASSHRNTTRAFGEYLFFAAHHPQTEVTSIFILASCSLLLHLLCRLLFAHFRLSWRLSELLKSFTSLLSACIVLVALPLHASRSASLRQQDADQLSQQA